MEASRCPLGMSWSISWVEVRLLEKWQFLAGVPRTATVIADSTVNALWLNTESMQAIMADSPELSGSLWKTAAMRFAENLLGAKEPYNGWSQIQLRRWLNEGEVICPSRWRVN